MGCVHVQACTCLYVHVCACVHRLHNSYMYVHVCVLAYSGKTLRDMFLHVRCVLIVRTLGTGDVTGEERGRWGGGFYHWERL